MAGLPVEVSREQEQRHRNEKEPNGQQPVENPVCRAQQGNGSGERDSQYLSHSESGKGGFELGQKYLGPDEASGVSSKGGDGG